MVVNNAGYGQVGTLEELSDEECRQNFDVNVFGSLNIIRKVMPHFREQNLGHFYNISSVGGFVGNFPGWGIYCATKYAMVGFTEALSEEIKSFGITATVVCPGYFRTNFLDQNSLSLPKKEIAEYKEARKSQTIHLHEISGNQPGNPEKAAEVLIEVAKLANPPLHLFLGSDAYKFTKEKFESVLNEMDAYKTLGTSTDY